jgi:AcrR family transcriptional regulator
MASKTKNNIVNAFLELAKDSEVDKITVTDLVDTCQISRQTFYYHFDDIQKMIEWAFDKETKNIIFAIPKASSWLEAISGYVDFFEKYEYFFKKALHSRHFIVIHNLLYKSFTEYIIAYTTRKKPISESMTENADFIVKCTALTYVGLFVSELQKEKPDYQSIFDNLTKSTGHK